MEPPENVYVPDGSLNNSKTDVPFLTIIICAVFLTVVIIGFVFITSKAKFTIMEKEQKAREEEERVRIEAVTQSYEEENARVMAMSSYRPPTIDFQDMEEEDSFFGHKPSTDGTAAGNVALPPDQPGAPVLGAALPLSDEPQLPPSPPPIGMSGPAPQLPPSPPPGAPPQPGQQPGNIFNPSMPPQGAMGPGQPPVAPPMPPQMGPGGLAQFPQQQAGTGGPAQFPQQQAGTGGPVQFPQQQTGPGGPFQPPPSPPTPP